MTLQSDTLPVKLYNAAQVRALDARLIAAAGTPGFELMQRAAQAAWQALCQGWPDAGRVTVLAGRGNNAGDGYLLALLAHQAGWKASVLAVDDPSLLQGDAGIARDRAVVQGVPVRPWTTDAELSGVIIDALLGTGLNGKVREPYRQAIEHINACGQPVLAIDLPSGLSADTGAVLGCAVRATVTVTFIGMKIGLLCGAGPDHCGRLVFAALQADPQIESEQLAVAERLVPPGLPRLPARMPGAHKGLFGHVLAVAGGLGMGGAALLCVEGALRAGAGLVSLVTRPEHIGAALVRCPEVMSLGVSSVSQVLTPAERASVVVVGPGLGQDAWARSLLSGVMNCPVPQVWDADALNLLATGAFGVPEQAVLTPHPGEAARLLNSSVAEIQADRPAAVRALAKKYGAVIVLKGAGTLIADTEGRLSLCDRGHPAMAGAGLGDVLSGLIGALLAQGLSTHEAARLGVWLHARAGERLAEQGRGVAAGDLPAVIRQLLEAHCPCTI